MHFVLTFGICSCHFETRLCRFEAQLGHVETHLANFGTFLGHFRTLFFFPPFSMHPPATTPTHLRHVPVSGALVEESQTGQRRRLGHLRQRQLRGRRGQQGHQLGGDLFQRKEEVFFFCDKNRQIGKKNVVFLFFLKSNCVIYIFLAPKYVRKRPMSGEPQLQTLQLQAAFKRDGQVRQVRQPGSPASPFTRLTFLVATTSMEPRLDAATPMSTPADTSSWPLSR